MINKILKYMYTHDAPDLALSCFEGINNLLVGFVRVDLNEGGRLRDPVPG